MSLPIADLHCDLLCYLERSHSRKATDRASRCSIPHLQQGHVQYQTLAVFAETGPNSLKEGIDQTKIFKQLPKVYHQEVYHFDSRQKPNSDQIAILLAFENASTFCSEDEPLDSGLKRLEEFIHTIAKPLYISLTWNGENRFGGGAFSSIGLKEDGKRLLEFMNPYKIAVDLSHTSDPLAYDILNYVDKKNLNIPIIASHSNSRQVSPAVRNLPDEIAKEIFRRKGIIGLNLYSRFVGSNPDDFIVKHLSHWIDLGGQHQICFGADFFCDLDFPMADRQPNEEHFFKDYADSSCYGRLLQLFRNAGFEEQMIKGIASQNFLDFIKK